MKDLFQNTKKPFVWIDINDIIPTVNDPVNQKLKEDILKNGMLKPLLLHKEDKICLMGNQRYVILKELGIKKIPVQFN